MKLDVNKQYSGFVIRQAAYIDEIQSEAYVMEHTYSGARLLYLGNNDDNKVFSISFRTPPYDDTGVAHILEHSVLCGSRKYRLKEPFVELVKGSMNTFLNAMTYPDKTMYPVASRNAKDFQNLMDVYLDAVFYPLIYENPYTLRQEGWHYNIEAPTDALSYNGVVYNEMKGVFSSADALLDYEAMKALFPDTPYSFESGGHPDAIPELTQEAFEHFHTTYYSPENSFIYLYGDMDMEERLRYLDEQYLSAFDKADVPGIEDESAIGMQKTFERPAYVEHDYAVTEDEPLEDNAYLSYNTVVGTSLDAKLYLAMQVLDYALVMAPGAGLKQALLDNGIGTDVYSSYENSILQPVYSVIARGASAEQKEEFVRIIKDVLKHMAEEGIDRDTLLAGINVYEFRYREADFGQFPKGLMYGLQLMDSWLYDDNEPFMHINAGTTFDELKREVNSGSGYFENIIREYLLDNNHASLLVLNPKANLTQSREKQVSDRLAAYKASLTDEQIEDIVKSTAALKKYQEEPSSQEELKTIPMLSISDIKKEAAPLHIDENESNGVKVIRHNIFTNRISYILLSFDCRNVRQEDIPYIGILSGVLGLMDTENYGYADLSTQINLKTGGIYTSAAVYSDKKDFDIVNVRFETKAKVLYENAADAFSLVNEMLFTTKFGDYKRLKEILDMGKSRMESMMAGAGHSIAMLCASKQFSKAAWYSDSLRGYSYYTEVCRILKNFDEEKEKVAEKLEQLVRKIFIKENLIVSFTADDKGYGMAHEPLDAFTKGLSDVPSVPEARDYKPEKESLGLTSSSQVQYVARCGNFRTGGVDYTGALRVLKVIFSYDYLWINVRVKGGAYGCMSGSYRNGDMYMVSYRDPNLRKTNEIYENAADYLEHFDVSDRDMVKFIIGTIGDIDTPMNPAAKGTRSFGAYICNTDYESLKAERAQVLDCNVERIRELAPLVRCAMDENYFCVVGSSKEINKESELFDKIQPLIKVQE